jgi:hypothetical protein
MSRRTHKITGLPLVSIDEETAGRQLRCIFLLCEGGLVLTMNNDVIAVVCDGPGPDWQRTAIVQNRKVFFPGAVFFSCDKAAFLCACFDGVETITNEGRIFLDSEFLAREFSNQKDEIKLAAKRIFEKAVRA